MGNAEVALRQAQRLIKNSPNDSVARAAAKVERLLSATPMSVILAKVMPDAPVGVRIKALGVSRATYYYWLNGTTRPSKKQAKRLATLSGFPVDEIRGHVA